MNILFFSPYQAIHQHSFVERKFAEILEKNRHKVHVLLCDRFFERGCLAMEPYKVDFKSSESQRQNICNICKKAAKDTWAGSKRYYLNECWTPELEFEYLSVIERIKSNQDIFNFRYLGIKIARLASYELILKYKISDIYNLQRDYSSVLWLHISQSLKSLLVFKKIHAINNFSHLFMYNSNYSINSVVRNYAILQGVKVVSLELGPDIYNLENSCMMTMEKQEQYLRNRVSFFEENFDKLKIDLSRTNKLLDSISKTLGSSSNWTYSSAKTESPESIYNKLHIDNTKPTALISTASLDEIIATDFAVMDSTYIKTAKLLFENQLEWLKYTIDIFRKNPRFQLIIRVHPREFPNKRENVKSKMAETYQEMADKCPTNVRFNFPEDNISIYDLFEVIHINISSWSSVVIESCLFGIPSISYSRGISLYSNKCVGHYSDSLEDYSSFILKTLDLPFSRDINLVKSAYDWLSFNYNHSNIHFDTNNYWQLKRDILSRLYRKFKTLILKSPRSYAAYRNNFTISQEDEKYFMDFVSTGTPLYMIKNPLNQTDYNQEFDSFLNEFKRIAAGSPSINRLTSNINIT